MRSYDFRHPKGNKYTEAELRVHRDNWYEKVAAGGGLVPQPEHVVVDKEVFAEFQRIVPYFPTLDYLRGRNFAGFAFETGPLDPLFRYSHYSDRPEYEFLDPQLESARGAFVSAVRSFSSAVGRNTWTVGRVGLQSVPEEWEVTQPERFHQVVEELHSAADAIETTYRALIRTARVRLGVAGYMALPSAET
jgi:hypothetical protein